LFGSKLGQPLPSAITSFLIPFVITLRQREPRVEISFSPLSFTFVRIDVAAQDVRDSDSRVEPYRFVKIRDRAIIIFFGGLFHAPFDIDLLQDKRALLRRAKLN
jgi:hypothetical protein